MCTQRILAFWVWNSRVFYVLWHSLSTVVLSSPKNFLCGKLDDSRLCLLCGKIALCYFVEKSLGGYCSTFICNGLHTYALSIFGSFVKMSVLFIFVCVCVCILLFFSNISFFAFQWKICGFMCKNRTQDFGVLISQQFILHGTFGKKVQVRSISRSCLLLLNQNYLIVYQSRETFG